MLGLNRLLAIVGAIGEVHMKNKSQGFILIEAVIALMVLAVGLLGVSKLQVAVVAEGAASKARAEAMTIAQARMDRLRLIARQSEHYSTPGGVCTAGSLVTSGNATSTGINASFTETWSVTVSCTPLAHRISVTVAWTDPKQLYGAQSVVLNGAVAWNDPSKNYPTLAGGASGTGGGLASPTNVRLGDGTEFSGSQPGTSNGKDGTTIYYNTTTKEYQLTIPGSSSGKYQIALYSNVPIVRVTGLVVLDQTVQTGRGGNDYAVNVSGSGSNQLRLTNIDVYRTDITYCLFPLAFWDQNDPSTYGSSNGTNSGQPSGASDPAGAYVCYVPEGWAGNIGLLNYELGTNGNPVYYACPDDRVDTSIFSGARSHRVEIVNGSNAIVGQSGVLSGHQKMLMPNYSSSPVLTRLSRLDFLVFKIPSGTFNGCVDRIGSTVDTDVSAGNNPSNNKPYNVILRNGAPQSRSTAVTGYTPGVPSIRYSSYAVDRYTSGVDGGFVTVSGSYTGGGSGGCTNSNIRAVGSNSAFLCSVFGDSTSGTYSCSVSYGWSGNIGYWNGSSVSSGYSVSSIAASTTSGSVVTCP